MKKKGHHGGHYAATVVPFLYDKGVSLGKLDGCYFAKRTFLPLMMLMPFWGLLRGCP